VKSLGLNSAITRRDFLCGSTAMIAALAACRGPREQTGVEASFDVGPEWYGPGGVGDYASSHGNTPEVLRVAHLVREGAFDAPGGAAIDTNEAYDLVVVGGGIAGLAAAHHFRRLSPAGRVLILENHPIFGGEAKQNEFLVRGRRLFGPQGSNDFGILPATGDPGDYFTALGIPREFDYVEPEGPAAGLRVPLDHYSYLHWKSGAFDVGHFVGDGTGWIRDLWNGNHAAWFPGTKPGEIERWRGSTATDRADGELEPWLDSMTVKQYYEGVLGLPREITAYVDPILASIIGLGCDAISAWWGWHFQLPGFRAESRYTDMTFHAFPGGNTGFARYFVKALVPGSLGGSTELADVLEGPVDREALDRGDNPVRIRSSATVVRVEHGAGGDVDVTYVLGEELHRLKAKGVVMASGGWINRRVIRDLPEDYLRAYDGFRHSAVLVANVALENWRFLAKLGIAAGIWSAGFGFSGNIRRPMVVGNVRPRFHPDEPTVLTFYVPLFSPGIPPLNQGQAGRLELLQTPFREYERRIREQMVRLFGDAGFEPETDIAGIILNRWGHAYVAPGPGFMFGIGGGEPAHEVIRRPFGRIAIGHSELRGHQNWTGAAAEGRRAVEALLS
jgi:spermidine dehydrogenase